MESNLTPFSGQYLTTNSQSTRSKIDLAWEHVSKERYANGRKVLICLYCKKIAKGGVIHKMKQHLAGVKGDIGPCKSVPPDVKFQMENSLQEFVNSKKATQEAYDYRNPYGPNMSQFEGDMTEGEEEPMLDAIFAIGPRYKGPNYHQLWVNLLKDAKKEVQLIVNSYRVIWAKVGCTIMGDGWTDNRQRLINFLMYCSEGISFVKSVDASDIVKDATNLFLPLNVVHKVTDNVTNYVATERLISQKHKHINWSPCATHCLNLIFKDIGKMDNVTELVTRASKVTIFVYNHVALLSWLRKKNGWIEILRPSATRFAATFIALKSLHDHKHDLQALVTSKFFVDSRYSKDNKNKVAISIILDNIFWNDCLIVVNLMSPLMRLLRIVDFDERPSMGYVYEGMYRVRLGIKKLFNYNKRLYKPYIEIIKQHWNQQLKKNIHSTAYWSNPCFQYDQENFCNKSTVIGGVMDVIGQKVLKGKLDMMNEMKLFRDRLGSFGRDVYSSREMNGEGYMDTVHHICKSWSFKY
ncbi:hypothetical protein AAG906_023752 [Vitis piasezkii]